eukprot:9905-Heterococcus_DN1.PRE.1
MGWLIKKGWKWKRGSGLRDFLYLRPGITRLRNAIENVHYFTSLPSMHEWVKANWRSGEWKRKLELTARPASAASSPAVQADSKALRESVAAGGKVRIGPDGVPIRGPNDARPVGNPWFVSGTRDRYYHSLMKCKERFRPGDCVMLRLQGSGPNRARGKQAPAEIVYICVANANSDRIDALDGSSAFAAFERAADGTMMLEVRWLYSWHDVPTSVMRNNKLSLTNDEPDEVYETGQVEEVEADCLNGKVTLLTYNEYLARRRAREAADEAYYGRKPTHSSTANSSGSSNEDSSSDDSSDDNDSDTEDDGDDVDTDVANSANAAAAAAAASATISSGTAATAAAGTTAAGDSASATATAGTTAAGDTASAAATAGDAAASSAAAGDDRSYKEEEWDCTQRE